MAAAFLLNAKFGIVTLGYLLLQVSYTFVLKHHVLIDVFAIAGGFVFRAVDFTGMAALIDLVLRGWLADGVSARL